MPGRRAVGASDAVEELQVQCGRRGAAFTALFFSLNELRISQYSNRKISQYMVIL